MTRRLGRLFLTIFGILSFIFTQAQTAKLSGKVTNSKNEALSSVSIKITGAGGTASDADGHYVLTLEVGKKYELTFSAVGYEPKTITDAEVTANQVNELNIVLEIKATSGEAVVVTARRNSARLESVASIISFQKNTNTVASVISAESIRRSPDKNTGEVLKRTPGTSIQEGKYLIVRGLADRYNQAMLNGILLSSTEPDRKTFSFDIFPSGIVDNIIINKAFVPELPGEWAGGLVQVNTKDIPATGFFNVQIGTGFNTNTIGKDFYRNPGGKYDWLGLDDKSRALPSQLPVRADFLAMKADPGAQAKIGTMFRNNWDVVKGPAQLNTSAQISGGFNKTLKNNMKLGGIFGATYNFSVRNLEFENRFFSIDNSQADILFDYSNNKYSQDVLAGAFGNLSFQFNSKHKITVKNLLNINSSDFTTMRTGYDYEADPVLGQNIRAKELAFKSNIYYNAQITGEHTIGSNNDWRFKWYGAFNILDQYVPDQRRIQYNQKKDAPNQPYMLLISGTLSQKSGSRFYQNLNDYIYTAGGDLSKSINALGGKQTIKGGYFFQVKDRLFDSRPFSIYLPTDNPNLRLLPEGLVFDPANFGVNGEINKFGFDEIGSNKYRYLANSILNAGYLQLDNEFGKHWRLVWGARVEHFDQLIGSVKVSDDRHVRTKKLDVLPGVNLTYKLNPKTNIRVSGSQTIIRPEFRELAPFTFFDFELNAAVLGSPELKRSKISNADIRYEIYPRSGELFSVGAFYKYFKDPIEQYFNQSGVATSTFNFLNAKQATSYGVEAEFRKKLDVLSDGFKNFTVQGNLSYIYNRVKDEAKTLDRPMQGQSPYVINVGLQYDVEKLGLNTTVLFNQIGRRILLVGNEQVPAIWENSRPLLDFQIAKKLMKNKGEIRLNIQDIINQRAFFYHDLNSNDKFEKSKDALAISRLYGTNVSLTFSYSFK
jgi:outer membrane receptor protein involved in Fe transport